MRLLTLKLLPFILLTAILVQAAGALGVPALKGRVNDYAGMLSPATARQLEQKLALFEQETSNQLVLLTIPSLQDAPIEQAALRTVEAWKLGQRGKDNGVLLILARQERKIRIEVGTGLQGALPDITAGQIIRNVIAPKLRNGDFDGGISTGLSAIIAATQGEFKTAPREHSTVGKQQKNDYGLFLMLLLAGVMLTLRAAASSRFGGMLAGGISLPLALGFGLGVTLLSVLGIFALLGSAAGLIISTILHIINRGGRGGGYGGGGWGGPTIFYGGGGGFSSGGGDFFSGGGGGFDGGGASGDW